MAVIESNRPLVNSGRTTESTPRTTTKRPRAKPPEGRAKRPRMFGSFYLVAHLVILSNTPNSNTPNSNTRQHHHALHRMENAARTKRNRLIAYDILVPFSQSRSQHDDPSNYRTSSCTSSFRMGWFNLPLSLGPSRVARTLHRNLPPLNFISVHYIYFIGTSLLSALIFWGASTPPGAVSFTDSLFLTVSAMTLA